MSRIAYVNGAYLPAAQAQVSIFDRGVLFADAVYEVTAVIDGGMVDFAAHERRLQRSLDALSIPLDAAALDLHGIHRTLIERNALNEGLVYLQISRGVADRSFIQPTGLDASVLLFTQALPLIDNPDAARGLRVITAPDLRWHRRDIKTTQLLYPSMMKSHAVANGVDDVWMVEGGYITEGTSSNAHIITRDGRLVTRALSNDILHGITRAAVLDYAREAGLTVEERAFTPEEAIAAEEAFSTSATAFVTPVVEIDGAPVGTGHPGPATERLRALYIAESRKRLSH